MPADSVTPHLVELGFSELEADVYVEMLRASPRTGYQVAKAIGKPVANTYKAVEALRRRGAILADAREPKLCRAVPIDDVLARCERQFQQHRDRAAAAARRLRARPSDAHTSRLATAKHAFERAQQMIQRAQKIILIDAFPASIEHLRADLESAIRRGVRVAILAYDVAEVDGAEVVMHPYPRDARRRWPGGWLNVVADSVKDLVTVFAPDGSLADGMTSDDMFLALIHESGLYHELLASRLVELIANEVPLSQLKRAIKAMERYRHVSNMSTAKVAASARRVRVGARKRPT